MALSDNLGDLALEVGADISPFEEQLNALPAAAQQAAAGIDAALANANFGDAITEAASAASASFDEMAQHARDADNAMGMTAQAAQQAAPHIEDLGQAHKETGAAAEEHAGKEGELGEKLLGLLEALAVAEGMREFAMSAIEASENVEKASISLTALTGSSEQAEERITMLRDLAQQDALSFPAVLTAGERMAALGLSSEQTSAMVQMAADAAAATNRNFDQMVNMLDRMVTSGMASGRTLASIGVSAQQMADVMGVSTDKVTKAFKLLDEGTRLDVLQAAMSASAGTAQQMADTFSGQMQRISNSTQQAMEIVGGTLAKDLQPLLSFIQGSVVPGLQELAKWFDSLPGPVRTFTEALGGVSVAAAALGGVASLLISALGEVAVPLLAAGAGASIMAAAFVTAYERSPQLQDAVDNLHTSVVSLSAEISKLASNLSPLLSGTLRDVTAVFTDLSNAAAHLTDAVTTQFGWLNRLVDSVSGVKNALSGLGQIALNLIDYFEKLAYAMAFLGPAGPFIGVLESLGEKFGLLKTQASDVTSVTRDFGAAMNAAEAQSTDFGATMDSLITSTTGLSTSTAANTDELKKKTAAALAAANADAEAKKAIADHSATLEQLTAAYGKHNDAVATATRTLTQAQMAYNNAAESGKGLAQAQDLLVIAQNQLIAALQKIDPLMKTHAQSVSEIGVQYAQAQMRVAAAAAALQQSQAAYQQAQAAGTGLAQAQAVLITAQEDYTKALQAVDPLMKLHVQSLQEMSTAYDQNQIKVQAAKAILDAATASLKDIRAASGDAASSIEVLGGSAATSQTQLVAAKVAYDSASASLQTLTAAHGNVSKALALTQQAEEQYLAALKAADPMAKSHGATLAELSAQYDANKLAVQQATATLNQAIAANDGSAKGAELVRMAHVDLTAAMKAFNEGTAAATKTVQTHSETLDQLNTKARDNVAALQQATLNLQIARGENDNTAMAVARLTQAERDYQSALSSVSGTAAVHVDSLQQLRMHEDALTIAIGQAKIVLQAAKDGYDGSSASVAILNAALTQFNNLVKQGDPLMQQATADLTNMAGAATGAATAISSAASALDGFQSTVNRSSTNVAMQDLMAMFGGYQSPLGLPSGVASMGPGYSTAGMNETIVGGEIVGASQITPGTMGPAKPTAPTTPTTPTATATTSTTPTVVSPGVYTPTPLTPLTPGGLTPLNPLSALMGPQIPQSMLPGPGGIAPGLSTNDLAMWATPFKNAGTATDQLTQMIAAATSGFTDLNAQAAALDMSMRASGLQSATSARDLISLSQSTNDATLMQQQQTASQAEWAASFKALPPVADQLTTMIGNATNAFSDLGAQAQDLQRAMDAAGLTSNESSTQLVQAYTAQRDAVAATTTTTIESGSDLATGFDHLYKVTTDAATGIQTVTDMGRSIGNMLVTQLDPAIQANIAAQDALTASMEKANMAWLNALNAGKAATMPAWLAPNLSTLTANQWQSDPFRGVTPTGSGAAPVINVNLQGGSMIVGQGGMQQLSQMVGNQIVDTLRRNGMKF